MTTNEKKKRRLMMLEDVRVASPCPAKWDEMLGNERVRFCTDCEKNVHNLSAMSQAEAEDLMTAKEGDLCVRFFQRADGTIMTSDCPVGAKRKLRKRAALSLAAAGAMAALAAIGMKLHEAHDTEQTSEDTTEISPPAPVDEVETDIPEGQWIAGGLG